jgi:hypothetical protein
MKMAKLSGAYPKKPYTIPRIHGGLPRGKASTSRLYCDRFRMNFTDDHESHCSGSHFGYTGF